LFQRNHHLHVFYIRRNWLLCIILIFYKNIKRVIVSKITPDFILNLQLISIFKKPKDKTLYLMLIHVMWIMILYREKRFNILLVDFRHYDHDSWTPNITWESNLCMWATSLNLSTTNFFLIQKKPNWRVFLRF